MNNNKFTERLAQARANVKRVQDNVGFALAEKNIPHAPTWTLLTPQALDNILDALDLIEQQTKEMEKALDCIEATLGNMSYNDLTGDQQKALSEAWAMAREKRAEHEHDWVREHGSDGSYCTICGAGPSTN